MYYFNWLLQWHGGGDGVFPGKVSLDQTLFYLCILHGLSSRKEACWKKCTIKHPHGLAQKISRLVLFKSLHKSFFTYKNFPQPLPISYQELIFMKKVYILSMILEILSNSHMCSASQFINSSEIAHSLFET